MILKREVFVPRNYLSLTLTDYFTRFLGSESVTTKRKCRPGELKPWEPDTLYLLSETQVPTFYDELSYITII